MTRNTLNFLVDLALALAVLSLTATGLIVRFVLPPGSGSRRHLWGLGRHDWGDVHFWVAVSAVALLLVHVVLHWQWVYTTVLRLCRLAPVMDQRVQSPWRRNAVGIVLVLALVVLFWVFVWLASLAVQESSTPVRRGQDRGRAAGVSDLGGLSASAYDLAVPGGRLGKTVAAADPLSCCRAAIQETNGKAQARAGWT